MRILILWALFLTLACGDGERLPVSRLALEVVGGDGQAGQVAVSGAVPSLAILGSTLDVLPEPIVARVVDAAGVVAIGQSGAKLPANTIVRFIVPDDAYGEAAIGYAVPDDSGYVRDRWVRGTRAGDACMELRLMVRDSLIVAKPACVTFLPGPPVDVRELILRGPSPLQLPESLILDENGNAVPYTAIPSAFAHVADAGTDVGRRTLVADSVGCASLDLVADGDTLGVISRVTVYGDPLGVTVRVAQDACGI